MLHAQHLSKSFGHVAAVRNVSLTLEPGRIVGLVGASGSGKSTLLGLLAGLIDADAGTVTLDGGRVPGPAEVLVPGHARIRLVHQEYQLMPNVSIRENIAYALRYYDRAYRDYRVDQLLRRCRLEAVQHRQPRQVSGGEKQRTAIARALAEQPAEGTDTNVLLLDEPFSHLDLPNRLLIRDLVLDLVRHDHRTACLFVTHDATDALALADQLGVLRAGRLVQLGLPAEVYARPATAYVARLTGPANVLRARHLPLLGAPDNVVAAAPTACALLRPEHIYVVAAGNVVESGAARSEPAGHAAPDADVVPPDTAEAGNVAETGNVVAAGASVMAVVRATFFRGPHTEVAVTVADPPRGGHSVPLTLLSPRPNLQPGQPVRIRIDWGRLVWVKP